MDGGDIREHAAELVERETATVIESTRIAEQLTTSEGSALVIAVETADETYWVVDDGHGTACYPAASRDSADAVLTDHMTIQSW
ncbi:hypothetical protein [Halomarina litorea]|uniref:hypothetical protein n=1 Tax=Halomarina litorea TaxID=2961595 RepID=UPI0020C2DC5C|nr:hypothetical protein [Halomarina sp. BCD28]